MGEKEFKMNDDIKGLMVVFGGLILIVAIIAFSVLAYQQSVSGCIDSCRDSRVGLGINQETMQICLQLCKKN